MEKDSNSSSIQLRPEGRGLLDRKDNNQPSQNGNLGRY